MAVADTGGGGEEKNSQRSRRELGEVQRSTYDDVDNNNNNNNSNSHDQSSREKPVRFLTWSQNLLVKIFDSRHQHSVLF
jgi:hypothetical protein